MSYLEELAAQYGTDKGSHGYLPFYERHLGDLRDIRLLEIGVQDGASLRMWSDWIPGAEIVGVDISAACAQLALPHNVSVVITDVKVYKPAAPFNVIIDDGSHHASDVVTAIGRLWDSLTSGGWYVIEDWQVQFTALYGGTQNGSDATDLARRTLYRILSGGPSAAAELHAYAKILFLRKRESRDNNKETE